MGKKCELMLRSRPNPAESIQAKHDRFFECVLSMDGPWRVKLKPPLIIDPDDEFVVLEPVPLVPFCVFAAFSFVPTSMQTLLLVSNFTS